MAKDQKQIVTAPSEAPAPVPTRAITMLAIAAFASAANIRVCDPMLPDIAAEFSVSLGTAARTTMAFLLTYGVFQVLIGPLGDRAGKYRVAAISCVGCGVVSAAHAFAVDFTTLVVLRGIAGVFAGAIIPLALAWIGDVVAYEQRQGVIARFLSGQILGVVFGQVAGGLLIDALGWRAAFVCIGVLHAVAGIGLLIELGRNPLTRARTAGGAFNIAGIAAGTIDLLRRPWVQIILVAGYFEAVAFHGALAFVASDLRVRFGLSAGQSGAMLALFGAGALVYAINAPWLVARLGQRGLALQGSWIVSAALVVLALSPVVWTAPVAAAGLGLGFYMLHNTLQTNATQMAPEARGLAVSQFAFWLFLGQSSGVWLAGIVVDTSGARPVFLAAAAALLAVAWWFCRMLERFRKNA